MESDKHTSMSEIRETTKKVLYMSNYFHQITKTNTPLVVCVVFVSFQQLGKLSTTLQTGRGESQQLFCPLLPHK